MCREPTTVERPESSVRRLNVRRWSEIRTRGNRKAAGPGQTQLQGLKPILCWTVTAGLKPGPPRPIAKLDLFSTQTFRSSPCGIRSHLFLCVVQGCVRDDEPLDRAADHDVRVDDFIDVREGDAAVPDGVGIHDHRRADFALLEASGFIGADAIAGDVALGQLGFEYAMKFRFAGAIAAASRVPFGPLVGADENMLFKFRHGSPFAIQLSFAFAAVPFCS